MRATLYRRCQLEVFARFGECSRWDGLVQRLTVYADDARTVVSEVRTRAHATAALSEQRARALGLLW